MNMLVRSSAAVAVAMAAPAIAAAGPSKPSSPTQIALLWAQRQATKREYATAARRCTRLQAELVRRMPKPHPTITYSKENDADGLQFFLPDREPHSLHGYIWSREIEGAIAEIDQACAGYEHVGGELVLYPDRKRPISEQDAVRRARLAARLELSRQYEKKKDQIDREIGLTKLTRKIEDQILPRLSKIEDRIYRTPAMTRSDVDRKIAFYEADEDSDFVVKWLLRDFIRLAKLAPLPAAA
jgi:hypothetical protein